MALPTNNDQLMLELINRARANPEAEAVRLQLPNNDVNESVDTSRYDLTGFKQPLAWNEDLIAAADDHNLAMLDENAVNDNDFQAHTNPYTNSTPTSRAQEEGYTGVAGENIGSGVSSDSIDLTNATIERYESLFINLKNETRGHRINLLRSHHEEIGIDTTLGTNFSAGGRYNQEWPHVSMVTQKFGRGDATHPFLTGVVYNDADNDAFYDVGEGLGNVQVTAINSFSQPAGSITTYDTGGYQLELAPDTYQVTFTGDLDNDGNGGDIITEEVVIGSQNVKVDVECFLTGTRILTEHGEVAVEDLKIGDRIRTADGKLEPIKWIGRQTIQPDLVKSPLRGNPVLIKAGALGDNLPCRDLYVSPCHSLLVEGLLIDAGALVNDLSIVYTQPSEAFVYYHVELEHHALLVAEGASAESYLPQKETREEYDNSDEYEALHPHGSNIMLWPMDYPRVSSKTKVPRFVTQKLMAIAGEDLSLSA